MLDGLAHERTTAEIRGGIFAAEHLNNNAPIRVTQALLGHATLDTVMVYAKLYLTAGRGIPPAVRGAYQVHGEDSVRNPSVEEWAAFTVGCRLRTWAPHLCRPASTARAACSGCSHAKPKKSAAPVFRCMLASHRRALAVALDGGEPAGQIAARELEIGRGESASAAPRS